MGCKLSSYVVLIFLHVRLTHSGYHTSSKFTGELEETFVLILRSQVHLSSLTDVISLPSDIPYDVHLGSF